MRLEPLCEFRMQYDTTLSGWHTRVWLVPARDFSRLAYRRKRGTRVELRFKTPAEDRRWDRFTVDRKELGDRVAALIGATPAEKKIVAPARTLALRLVA